MYNLSFPEAHAVFQDWERTHPQDPRGPVFDGAAYLYAEFDRLKVLQSEFFTDNKRFKARRAGADPAARAHFEEALQRGKDLAEEQLREAPHDENALFASVLRLGLQADYKSLIERRDLNALQDVKEATRIASDLLSRYPSCYDAYVAIGVENYLLSLKPAPVRWILSAGGAETDREKGIEKLTLTATKGHYLQPYAELLLAVAALRDKDPAEARRLLSDLTSRFPHNDLYRVEMKKIESKSN